MCCLLVVFVDWAACSLRCVDSLSPPALGPTAPQPKFRVMCASCPPPGASGRTVHERARFRVSPLDTHARALDRFVPAAQRLPGWLALPLIDRSKPAAGRPRPIRAQKKDVGKARGIRASPSRPKLRPVQKPVRDAGAATTVRHRSTGVVAMPFRDPGPAPNRPRALNRVDWRGAAAAPPDLHFRPVEQKGGPRAHGSWASQRIHRPVTADTPLSLFPLSTHRVTGGASDDHAPGRRRRSPFCLPFPSAGW